MVFLFLLLCVFVVDLTFASSYQPKEVELPESQYMALWDIYNATDGVRWNWQKPYWANGYPWTFDSIVNPCTSAWQGVTCEMAVDEYSIQKLNLNKLRLRGSIPSSICNLSQINVLSVTHNFLYGTVPDCIGTLNYLTNMSFSSNHWLEGSIPESFRRLPRLETLFLDGNLFNGTLDLVCDIKSLRELLAFDNILTGTIPNCLDTLPRLERFEVYHNSIDGTIPATLGNCTKLTHLSINLLLLTGTIPSSLGNLTNLQLVSFASNRLTGTLPESLGNLSSLNQIAADSNLLSGTVPASLGQLRFLESISLGENSFSGTLPLTLFELRFMVYLEFNNNFLTGTIPEAVGALRILGDLSIENNLLTGSIPASLFNLTRLVNIYLRNNMLTGTLPQNIEKHHRELNYLQLEYNRLSGTIPSTIEYFASVFEINLSNNNLHGVIPASIGSIRTLSELDLSNNGLTGSIPETLQNLTQLATLSLQGNQLSGTLDGIVSPQQERVTTIRLDGNQFTGELPPVLFELPSLISLSIVGSCLHGTLPHNICNATQLEALILQGLTTGASCRTAGIPSMSLRTARQFEGTLPMCLLSMRRLRTLLLSSNGFTGELNNNGAKLGRILSQLDLSHNLLRGTIPDNIQNHNWTVLDLSHNKLNGLLSLPLKISKLDVIVENRTGITFHPSLYLDTNRLSGPVPNSAKQLQSNLSVLAGNLFQCRYDKTDLPQHDSDIDTYECASNTFDVSIYVWLGLSLCAVIFAVLYYRLPLAAITNVRAWWTSKSETPMKELVNLSDLHVVYERLNKVAGYCTLFCLLVLFPYYIVISHYQSTHTHTYAYVVSALYTSGIIPFVVTTILLFLLMMVVVVYFFRKWHTISHCDTPEFYSWRELWALWLVFAFTNTAVVLGFNILFVYIVLYQSSAVQTFAQVALSVFKLAWSVAVSPYMMRKLDAYYLPDAKQTARHNYFTLQLLVALFNNIAIPCLVVMAIDPNCFGNILLPPGERVVYYLLPVCERNGFLNPCKFQSVAVTSLQFTPPFTYSYQCSASFVTSYAPAFVYMSISNVFLHPLLQCVLLHIRSRAKDPSLVHRLTSWCLPRLLRPPTVKAFQRNLDEKRALVGASDVLVTLFTQLSILLTFGAIFPPVAIAMAVSIAAIVYLTRYKVQRFVQAAVDAQLLGYLNVINAECAGVGTREQMQLAVKIIVCYSCAFYTLFLFDTLGDAEGFAASAWVLIVVPLAPIAVFVINQLLCVPKLVIAEGETMKSPVDVELKEIRVKENVKGGESVSPLQFTVNPIRQNDV